jgi:hypothetical protein
MLAALQFSHPSGQQGTISMSSMQGSSKNVKELFNLRHSSLRVTIESAFDALKYRFKILDQKLFHPLTIRVNLVLACFILHNWILGWGVDEFLLNENDMRIDVIDIVHGVGATDNKA